MRSNIFDSMILGTIFNGQGSTIVVEGTHRTTLRDLVLNFARRLSLRLGDWRGFTRKAAGMAPAMAMCPSYSGSRWQRHQRSLPGVVVKPGTVGIS